MCQLESVESKIMVEEDKEILPHTYEVIQVSIEEIQKE